MEMHQRTISNIFDLLSNLGGVLEVLILFFFMFLNPCIRHFYYMNVLDTLYLAKTKDPSLFGHLDVGRDLSSAFQDCFYHPIKLSMLTNF